MSSWNSRIVNWRWKNISWWRLGKLFKRWFKKRSGRNLLWLGLCFQRWWNRIKLEIIIIKIFSFLASSAPWCKTNKERVTILICANSAETHLLLIGNSKKPQMLQNSRVPLFIKTKIVHGWTPKYSLTDITSLLSLKYKNFKTKLGIKEMPFFY